MISGSSPVRPARARAARRRSSGGQSQPSAGEVRRVLDLEDDADLAPLVERASRTRSSTSRSRRIGCWSSKRRARRPDLRQPLPAAQRRELVPGEVLGEPAGQLAPSTVFVVRRSANSGRSATSVVAEISFSCRTTSTPSFETTMSGSTASTPIARARSYDERRVLGPVAGRAAMPDDERASDAACAPGVIRGRSAGRRSKGLPARSQRIVASDIVDPQHRAVDPLTLECERPWPSTTPHSTTRRSRTLAPCQTYPGGPQAANLGGQAQYSTAQAAGRMSPPTRGSRACTPRRRRAPSRPAG